MNIKLRHGEEAQCDNCGFPLYCGDDAVVDHLDSSSTYCSRACQIASNRRMDHKPNVCPCGEPTNGIYCGSCSVKGANRIIAAGGRRVNEIAENEFDAACRH